MHADLQFFEHIEQFLHLLSLNCIFRNEKRLMKLSTVPTGQMVLQYVRPLRQANTIRIINITIAKVITTPVLGSPVSTW
jgi:hypothetical protein